MQRTWLITKIRDFFSRNIIKVLKKRLANLSLADKCRYVLERLNIQLAMDEQLQRDLLKIEFSPGLIICNHPSDIEQLILPVICSAHEKYKIIVSKKLIEYYETVGPGNFILAQLPYLETAVPEAVKDDYLVALFPSGGREHKFRRGFVKIVESLAPETMVYCLNVDEEDLKKNFEHWLRKFIYYFGLGLEVFFARWLNLNLLLPGRSIGVVGRYTKAEEFQRVMKEEREDLEKARLATEYYDSLWNI